jgi:hypothetical protein
MNKTELTLLGTLLAGFTGWVIYKHMCRPAMVTAAKDAVGLTG